jgi:glycogen synthase
MLAPHSSAARIDDLSVRDEGSVQDRTASRPAASKKRFSAARMAQQYVTIYERLLNHPVRINLD